MIYKIVASDWMGNTIISKKIPNEQEAWEYFQELEKKHFYTYMTKEEL